MKHKQKLKAGARDRVKWLIKLIQLIHPVSEFPQLDFNFSYDDTIL